MEDQIISNLINSLKAMLKARDFDMSNLSDSCLELEIRQAIGVINRCRNFTPTDTKMFDKKYEYLIIPMCVSSIAKIGAEGESTHSENGIYRMYNSDSNYPVRLTNQIIPLVK